MQLEISDDQVKKYQQATLVIAELNLEDKKLAQEQLHAKDSGVSRLVDTRRRELRMKMTQAICQQTSAWNALYAEIRQALAPK